MDAASAAAAAADDDDDDDDEDDDDDDDDDDNGAAVAPTAGFGALAFTRPKAQREEKARAIKIGSSAIRFSHIRSPATADASG